MKEYIDLGLPNGTLWCKYNEEGYYTYDRAMENFKNNLPSKDQFNELINECNWEWDENGYNVVGPNGNSIFLPAMGYHNGSGIKFDVGFCGFYWSSTQISCYYNNAWNLDFNVDEIDMDCHKIYNGMSVKLVKNK